MLVCATLPNAPFSRCSVFLESGVFMKKFLVSAGLVYLLAFGCFWSIGRANAQTFTILKSFGLLSNVTGIRPKGELVWGHGGTLYGTTSDGGGNVLGTVFKVQSDGSGFAVLKWFTNS